MNMELKPAYITIVEGPPPQFEEAVTRWSGSVMEGPIVSQAAMVQMRTLDGPKLVKRCADAWQNGRDARLDFPTADGLRAELDIVAARWEDTTDGQKLYLWVRIEGQFELDPDFFEDDNFDDTNSFLDF